MGWTARWAAVVGLWAAGEAFAAGSLDVEKQANDVLLWRDSSPEERGFGTSVAVVGTRLAIGKPGSANGAEAVVLVEPDGRIASWLLSPRPRHGSEFGAVLAGEGDRLFIGEPGAYVSASEPSAAPGAVHLADASSSKVIATFENPDQGPAGKGGAFGRSMFTAGGELIVGAPDQSCDGIAFSGRVFRFEAATGRLLASICNPTPFKRGNFGRSFAQFGTQLWVGVGSEKDGKEDAGLIRVLVNGSLIRSVSEPRPGARHYFGRVITRVGELIAVSASNNKSGVVYLFDPITWALTRTLEAPADLGVGASFGASMIAVGEDLLVGAPGPYGAGAVFLIDPRSGAIKRTLRGPQSFGRSLAVWSDRLVIGASHSHASKGGVYLIPRDGPAALTVVAGKPIDFSPKGIWEKTLPGEFVSVVRVGKALVAAGKAGVSRSEDGGKTWASALKIEATALAAFQGDAFVALKNQGLFHSKDEGRTWTLRAQVEAVRAMDASEHGLVIGTARGEVLLSKNSGVRWQALCLGLPESAQVSSVAAVPGAVLFTAEGSYRYDLETRKCQKLGLKEGFGRLSRGAAGEVLSAECDVRATDDGRHWAFPAAKDSRCAGPSMFGFTTALTVGDSVLLASDVGHLRHKRGAEEQLLTPMTGPGAFGTILTAMVVTDDAVVGATPEGLRRFRFPDGQAPGAGALESRAAALRAACDKGRATDCGTLGERLHFEGQQEEARAALIAGCEKGGEPECALLVDLVLAPERRGRSRSDVLFGLGELMPELLPRMEKVFAEACQRGAGRSCWRRAVLMPDADLEKMHVFFKKGCAAKVPDGESCERTAGRNEKTKVATYRLACRQGRPGSCLVVAPDEEEDRAQETANATKRVALFAESCSAGNDAVCHKLAEDMANFEPLLRANPELGVLLADRICWEGKRCPAVGDWLRLGQKGVAKDGPRGVGLYARDCFQERALSCVGAASFYKDYGVAVMRESYTDAARYRVMEARAEELFRLQCDAGDLRTCLDRADYLQTSNKAEAMKILQRTCDAQYGQACDRLQMWTLEGRCTAKDAKGCLELARYYEGRKLSPVLVGNTLKQACDLGEAEACAVR